MFLFIILLVTIFAMVYFLDATTQSCQRLTPNTPNLKSLCVALGTEDMCG